YVIDLMVVDTAGRLPRWIARSFQPLQNGVLQSYAVMMAGGIGLIAILVIFIPEIIRMLNSVGGG
ncbi:MAG: hypothetical protein KDA25_08270, partial [Phycisphaerales bacterium]|nr:hypothetical protein [Phycisphaerales bacterium]